MTPADLELCQELYKVSGWDDDALDHYDDNHITPKYDLGYLVKKLKLNVSVRHSATNNTWWAECQTRTANADTPENAAAKLAIKLIKEGILK